MQQREGEPQSKINLFDDVSALGKHQKKILRMN